MWILFLLFSIGIVAAVYYIIKNKGASNETALDILKKRYAKGEITKEEYEEKKKDI